MLRNDGIHITFDYFFSRTETQFKQASLNLFTLLLKHKIEHLFLKHRVKQNKTPINYFQVSRNKMCPVMTNNSGAELN